MRLVPCLDMLVGVLDHDHGRVDHRADGDGDATERHQVGADALQMHHDEGGEHAERQDDDGDQRGAQVPEEQHADQGDDEKFLDQLARQVADRRPDQLRAIVGRHDFHAIRQAGLEFLQARLDRVDRGQRIFPGAQDDHATGHFAFSVELGDAAAQGRAALHAGYVAQQDRYAVAGSLQRNGLEFLLRGQVADAAHHQLRLALLDHRTTAGAIRCADRRLDIADRDATCGQRLRIDDDLPGADHAADARDLGDIGDGLQAIAQEPVLQRAQFTEIVRAAAIDQRVFVDPANAGGVGPERRTDAFWQLVADLAQVFEDTRSRPVRIGAIFE